MYFTVLRQQRMSADCRWRYTLELVFPIENESSLILQIHITTSTKLNSNHKYLSQASTNCLIWATSGPNWKELCVLYNCIYKHSTEIF